MKAIIEINSKQYIVGENTIIDIDLTDQKTKKLEFNQVLCLYDGSKSTFGTPYIQGSKVTGTVLENVKSDKVLVFKFKTKTGYKKTRGHRQNYTRVQIDKIELGE